MEFEEAVAAPGRKVQTAGKQVKDGQRWQMIYSLAADGAKKLASRRVPVGDFDAAVAALSAQGIAVAETDFESPFVWVRNPGGIEVYDEEHKVLDANGDRATLVDGAVVARSEIARVFTFASKDYVHRGVKAALQSGKEVDLVAEISMSAMGDPTYTRNELLSETVWCSTLAAAIAEWAGTGFENLI